MELIFTVTLVSAAFAAYTEEDAVVFMNEFSKRSQELFSALAYKRWDYSTTLTDQASRESEEAKKRYYDYQSEMHSELMKFPWHTFKDPLLKRQFLIASNLGEGALPKEKGAALSEISNKMNKIYNTAKIREFKSTDNTATLNIQDIARKFRDDCLNAEEMDFYWREWHDTVGRAERELFSQWIDLENEVAVANNFENGAQRWQHEYETDNFEEVIAQLWEDIEPLFKELHAYVRYKLWIAHHKNPAIIDPDGPIPASLLGNMWGQVADNIYNVAAPYPNKPLLDASPQLKAQGYTGLKMAKAAENFYLSLGMEKMKDAFWENSIFERKGEMDCSAASCNFYNGYDHRIHFCTTPTQGDFGTMHHEMGHVENYLLCKDQPYFFQGPSNPGFGEAIGDLMYLYATSPNHLKRLGLIDADIHLDKDQAINALFQTALSTVFFFPYAYSLDLWRWDVMKGNIAGENYNCEYWKRRIKLQGVEPPVDRDETNLDPAAKLHIVVGAQYISYFVSGIVRFQFLKALCETSGYYDSKNPSDDKPLVFCDIYGSIAAGEKLKKMLAMGMSDPWPEALHAVTGQRTLDAAPLLEFYQPLYEWLRKENEKNHVTPGWNAGHDRCHS